MSAFICSPQHINAIVRWAGRHHVTCWHGNPSRLHSVAGKEQDTAALLYAENVRSVNYRYFRTIDTSGIVYDASAPDLRPIDVIKACDCLAYQSGEHPAWDDSLACRLLKEIQSAAITRLPGYDAAKWEITA